MTTLGDLTLPSPVLVAAGCGGTGRELEPYGTLDAVGGFVTRSITLDARRGAPGPRVVESPSGLVHDVGLPNPGLDQFLAVELTWLARRGVRTFVSVAGRTLGEYAELARRLGRAPGLAGIEVNLAEPAAAAHGLHDVREPFSAAAVVAAVRRDVPPGLVVVAKVRADLPRVVETARGVLEAGAAAVVVGGALPAAMPDGRPAGLSGPAIGPTSLRCVAEVCAALPGATVIGCGGISTTADARAHLAAGATAVQVGTALLADPTTATRLAQELAR